MFGNIYDYIQINHCSRSLSFKMLVHKCNFLLQLLLKINATFSQFYCNKNLPYLLPTNRNETKPPKTRSTKLEFCSCYSSSVMHTSLSFEPTRCSPTRLRKHSGSSPTPRAYTSHYLY